MYPNVKVTVNGGRATFILAPETDPEEGAIDLTPMLDTLVAAGAANPHDDADGGVPFGTIETDGDIVAVVDGRTLADTELAETLGAGFIHAIRLAIDTESARADAEDAHEQKASDSYDPAAAGPLRP